MKLRTCCVLRWVCLGVCLLCALTALERGWPEGSLYITMAVGALAVLLVLQLVFWRCPFCRRGLGRYHMGVPRCCPHCGKEINDDAS